MRILTSPTGPRITPEEARARTIPQPEGPQFRQGKERSYMDLLGDMLYAASSPLAGLKAAGFGLDGPMHIPTRYEVDKERYGMDYVLGLTPATGAAYLGSAALSGEHHDALALALAATPAGRNVAPFTRIVDEPIWQKITQRANELLADYQANPQSAPLRLKKDIGGTLELSGRPLKEFTDAGGTKFRSTGGVDVNLRLPDGTVIPTGSMGFSSSGAKGSVMDEGNRIYTMVREGDFPFERIGDRSLEALTSGGARLNTSGPPLRDQLIGSGASSLMTQALNQAMKEQGLRLASSASHSNAGMARYLKLKDLGVVKQIGEDAGKANMAELLALGPEEAAARLNIPAPSLDDLDFMFPGSNVYAQDFNEIDRLTNLFYTDAINAKMFSGGFADEPQFLFYRDGGKFKILKR